MFTSILPFLLGLSNFGCKANAEEAPKTLELGPMLGYIGPDIEEFILDYASHTLPEF